MDAVTGTDTWSPTGVERLLAGIRHLNGLADSASDTEAIFRALSVELLAVPGADEVYVHHLCEQGDEELVAVYVYGGSGRLSYLAPRGERPPGVDWVASNMRSFTASSDEEFSASVPHLAADRSVSSVLLLPLADRGEVEAVVMLVRRARDAFLPNEVELAAGLVEQAATTLSLGRARAEAGTDAVTGCMNHRAMRRRLDEEIGRAMRTGGPLSCLLIDLDDFKAVNDTHGHPAGDAMLRAVVHALIGEFRAFDRVARYGGDEFVVIMPNADLESAAAAANRALDHLRGISTSDGPLNEMVANSSELRGISASIGVAQWKAPMGTDELLAACDDALLRSKRQGKGRVIRASQTVR
jgi:diguanylate cyclase (GGDEF)-like protein